MKPLSGKILTLEIRVTPYDQKEITPDEIDLTHFTQFVLYREGEPNGKPRLHYHGIVVTPKSESWLRSFLRKLAHAPDQEKINGNALFFTKQPHEHTFGYVVKHNHAVISHGVTQTTLDEWLTQSAEYKKHLETNRKRKQRTREDWFAEIITTIEMDLKNNSMLREPGAIITTILAACRQENIRFPTRQQMELYVLKLLHPYDDYLVRSFYMRSFDR